MPEHMPKAIETVYNGYRFRSRLEARWAVFLDTLGIAYEYEKEGFELEGGVRYLPDFYLPQSEGLWVEIKPARDLTTQEIAKCAFFQRAAIGTLLILVGEPWHGEYGGMELSTDGTRRYVSCVTRCPCCPSLLCLYHAKERLDDAETQALAAMLNEPLLDEAYRAARRSQV